MNIKIGIVGGAGYTAGELLRLLLQHPYAQITWIHSNSHANEAVYSVHDDLLGETDLNFSNTVDFNIDALFLCSGHGKSKEFLEANQTAIAANKELKIIDLSSDFRHKREGNDFIYGLPELQKEQIQQHSKVANPGCFATAIQLALLPLAKQQLLKNSVHIQAITGSTGAGQKPTATGHFSWRNNNVSVYKAFQHQHIAEIKQSLQQLQSAFDQELYFIPVRGNFSRGIMATVYTEFEGTLEEAKALFEKYYADHPFVWISESNPHLKQVVNTNKGILYLEKHNGILLIISMIDNLLKGASGQAVQNMNLLFGLEETAGLGLKAVAF
ncbi:MAG: N-acetyl-gamma-glutamyl-phosphate reductase [Chitinophagales bacterium]